MLSLKHENISWQVKNTPSKYAQKYCYFDIILGLQKMFSFMLQSNMVY
jgi:hypothetical protein